MPQRPSPPGSARPSAAVAVATAGRSLTSGSGSKGARQSNGLKEFLWQLDGIGHGHLLDLGPARQSTITFFIERGFKVYTEDLLATWQYFLEEQGSGSRSSLPRADRSELTPEGRAEKFLETTMLYPGQHVRCRADVGQPGLSRQRTDDEARHAHYFAGARWRRGLRHVPHQEAGLFHRYKVLDAQNLELIPASCPFQPQRVFQNREISNLFARYRTSKMFVGRDQIREGLFVK